MKKKLIAFLVVLLALMCLATTAYANYDNFIAANLGDYFEIQLFRVASGTNYTYYDMPAGLYIEEDPGAGSVGLTLKGNCCNPGTYNFGVTADDGQSVSYEIMVRDPSPDPTWAPEPTWAPAPTAAPVGPVRQPPYILNQTYAENLRVGESCYLHVTVDNPGGYDLYYNWFINGVQNLGADADSYYVYASHAGNDNYSCRIDYYINGVQNSIYSSNIVVRVEDAKPYVTSIEMAAYPYKTEYTVGDYLDTSGMSIRVYYSDGNVDTVSSGFVCNPSYITTAGTQNINVQYNGCYTMFKVKAKNPVTLTGINVSHAPDKINYNIGENLDTSGLIIQTQYSDGSVNYYRDGFICTPTSFNTEGTQTVQVSFDGQTASFKVTVQDPNKPTGITIQSLPTRLEYNLGDNLDINGLKLKVSTANGSNIVDAIGNTKVSVDPNKLTKAGQQTITVVYTDGSQHSCTYTVHVTDPAANPSPSPSATPTASPSASPETSESPAPDAQQTGMSTMVIVLFAACAIAITVLAVLLVVVLNKDKKRR